MEFYDHKDKKIVSLLKSAKSIQPDRVLLTRVLQGLALDELKAERAQTKRGGLFGTFGARYIFAGFLVLLAVVGSVRLMTPSHMAVASEIAALELASDEISSDIDQAEVFSGEAGVYELDLIGIQK